MLKWKSTLNYVQSTLLVAIFTETVNFFVNKGATQIRLNKKNLSTTILFNNTTMMTSRERSSWWKEAEIF